MLLSCVPLALCLTHSTINITQKQAPAYPVTFGWETSHRSKFQPAPSQTYHKASQPSKEASKRAGKHTQTEQAPVPSSTAPEVQSATKSPTNNQTSPLTIHDERLALPCTVQHRLCTEAVAIASRSHNKRLVVPRNKTQRNLSLIHI